MRRYIARSFKLSSAPPGRFRPPARYPLSHTLPASSRIALAPSPGVPHSSIATYSATVSQQFTVYPVPLDGRSSVCVSAQVGRLVQAHQRQMRREYAYVCFTRLDIAPMTPFPWTRTLEMMAGTQQIAFPNSQFWGGVNDRFALGPGHLMLNTLAPQFDIQHASDDPFIFADKALTSEYALCAHLSRARLNISIVPLPLCLLRVRPNREAVMCDVDPHPVLCTSSFSGIVGLTAGFGHGDHRRGGVPDRLACLTPPRGSYSDVIWHPGSRQSGCDAVLMQEGVQREKWKPVYEMYSCQPGVRDCPRPARFA